MGDSILHGDGYGKPSESIGALIDREIPIVNVTAPSLTHRVAVDLFPYLAKRFPDDLIVVQLNMKWVTQNWYPDKFENLHSDIFFSPTQLMGFAVPSSSQIQNFILFVPEIGKLKFRFSNFTIGKFFADFFRTNPTSFWNMEWKRETAPNYDVTDVQTQKPEALDSYKSYHLVAWNVVDNDEYINSLINLAKGKEKQVAFWISELNPEWSSFFGATENFDKNLTLLRTKIESAGFRVLRATSSHYHDDMHYSTEGAQEIAHQLARGIAEITL